MSVLLKIQPQTQFAPGTHKYVLIEAEDEGGRVYFVRSDSLEYHRDIFKKFIKGIEKHKGVKVLQTKKVKGEASVAMVKFEVEGQQATVRCLGGGRAQHNQEKRTLFIYGYSKTYGRVDHSIARELALRELKYQPAAVTTSDQGY